MYKNIKIVFLFLLVLFAIQYFMFRGLERSALSYLRLGYIIIVASISSFYFFRKGKGFNLPVQLISASILLSVFSANVSWGQGLVQCIIATAPFTVWFLYFFLFKIKFPVKYIENIILIYGVIYLILYLFQFTHPDTIYFGGGEEEFDDSRGIIRIVFPGRGLFYYSIFLALSKFSTSWGKSPLWWGFLILIGVIVTVMQVTRQFIFATLLIYLFHFFKYYKLHQKIIITLVFLIASSYFFLSENPIADSLRNVQKETVSEGEDYIRVKAAKYYLTEFSNSTFTRIFGNGVPYWTSDYGKFDNKLSTIQGYWLADVGLVAIYAMFGIFAVIGYLLIWVNSFILKLPKEYSYLKYYLWFLMITCLTSDTIYASGDLIVTVLVVYSYQAVHEEEIYKNKIIHHLEQRGILPVRSSSS